MDRPVEDFVSQMQLNYVGAVTASKAVVRRMVARKQRGGRLLFVSSQGGMTGCIGYAAYSPTKFAVRGLAECLRHELLPYGISVHCVFPGNMRTPGYEHEQLTKPAETKAIESGEPLQDPDEAARATLDSLRKGDYAIFGGNFSGFFLGRASAGLTPRSTLMLDVLLAPILVLYLEAHRVFVLDRAVAKVPEESGATTAATSVHRT